MKSFLTWLESEESPALSEPQHKKGEANMALDDIVGRRVKSMIMELEGGGKGTQKEILASVGRYLKKMGSDDQNQPQGQQQQSQQPQDQMEPQPQGMEINPAAQGRVPGNL